MAKQQNETTGTVPYTVTDWNGNDNYMCGLCPAAHLDLSVLQAHAKAVHKMPLAESPGT